MVKVNIRSYNYVGGTWNPEFEETSWVSYTLEHTFDNPAACVITLADPTGTLSQRYNDSGTEVLSGAVQSDGGAETDETDEANDATANDMHIFPAVPALNDAYYFGFASKVGGFTLDIGTAFDGNDEPDLSIIWEYSQGADAWAALADVTGITQTTDMTVGEHNVSWTVPGDWATDEVGSISGIYWVRVRIDVKGPFAVINVVPLGTQAWIPAVYIGPGKVTIEDPDATDIFSGRIMSAKSSTRTREVTLYCLDWLSQLSNEQIDYAMPEDLNGSGLRVGRIHPDMNGNAANTARPAYSGGGASNWIMTDSGDETFGVDDFNDMYFIMRSTMGGVVTSSMGPYTETVTGDGAGIDLDAWSGTAYEDAWTDDDAGHTVSDNDEDWTTVYEFFNWINAAGNDYHSTTKSMKLELTYSLSAQGVTATVEIYDNNAAAYVELETLQGTQNAQITKIEIQVPEYLMDYATDASGITKVKFSITRNGIAATHTVYHLRVVTEAECTQNSTAYLITDTATAPRKIETAQDTTLAGTGCWTDLPFSIARPIYWHLDTDQTPGTLITDGAVMEALTCAATVEHTSGISTRHYVGKTRLEILKDLAIQDKAHFWIALGGTTVTYKSTFGAATETLSDADANAWESMMDFETVANSVTVYGAKQGDERLSSTYTDTASVTKYGITITKIVNDTGVVTAADTLARATAVTNRDKEMYQILRGSFAGNMAKAAHAKTLKLGDIVSITSTYLGLSSAAYIVQQWQYDSTTDETTLLLHPHTSTTGLQPIDTPTFASSKAAIAKDRKGSADAYVSTPPTTMVND